MHHSLSRAVAAVWALVTIAAANAQDRETIAAAQREGSVTIYAGFPNAALHALMPASFRAKYGIRVDLLSLRSSELNERIRTEQAAGRFLGDVLLQGESSTMLHIAAGRMEPVGALSNVDRLLPQYDRADPTRVPAFVGAYAVMVNTNLVTPQQEPKTWLDLLDPKWNGKTLIDDPRAAGGGGAFFQAVSILHTDDFHMRLARNAPTFTRDPGAAERRVARGEYAIWLPAMIASMQGLQGLPVRFLAPEAAVPSIRMDLTRL